MPFALTSPVPDADPAPFWITEIISAVARSAARTVDTVGETLEGATSLTNGTTGNVLLTDLVSAVARGTADAVDAVGETVEDAASLVVPAPLSMFFFDLFSAVARGTADAVDAVGETVEDAVNGTTGNVLLHIAKNDAGMMINNKHH